MRLPNGYGSVYKLSGNRRKPWIVRRTKEIIIDDESNKAKQIYEIIGYYETKQKALAALANFNENPYDVKTDSITFEEVYEKWSEEHYKTISASSARSNISAFKHSSPLHKMRMKDIRAIHLESTINDTKVSGSVKERMKSLYNLLYRYCLKHEIVDKDYAALCNTVKRGPREKEVIPFTDKEVKILWENIDFPFVDMILIGIYSGWRPQELSILKTNDIDLKQNTMLGGLKTDAGKNRYVPIHPLIKPLIIKRYNVDNEYLFNDENGQQGTVMTYDKYRGRFNKVMEKLSMKHRPHEARHTFITKAKISNMDEYILKLIVGHVITDITERVYTHRTMEQLQEEILKIKE